MLLSRGINPSDDSKKKGSDTGEYYFCDAVTKSYVIKDAWDDEITLSAARREIPRTGK
jgi:hypothetical protein